MVHLESGVLRLRSTRADRMRPIKLVFCAVMGVAVWHPVTGNTGPRSSCGGYICHIDYIQHLNALTKCLLCLALAFVLLNFIRLRGVVCSLV